MPARKRKSARKTIPAIRAAVPKPVPLAQARSALNRARRAVFARTAAKMMTTRATAFDDQARDFLDNIELKKVLAEVARRLRRPIDVVGFVACLMSMLEVDYQIAGRAVRRLVAGGRAWRRLALRSHAESASRP